MLGGFGGVVAVLAGGPGEGSFRLPNRPVKLPLAMLPTTVYGVSNSDNPVHSRIAMGKKPEWEGPKAGNGLVE